MASRAANYARDGVLAGALRMRTWVERLSPVDVGHADLRWFRWVSAGVKGGGAMKRWRPENPDIVVEER